MITIPVAVPSHVSAALRPGEVAELDLETGAWFGATSLGRRALGLAERRIDVLRADGSLAQSVEFRPEINARCVVVSPEDCTVEVGTIDVGTADPDEAFERASLFGLTTYVVTAKPPTPVVAVLIPSEVKA